MFRKQLEELYEQKQLLESSIEEIEFQAKQEKDGLKKVNKAIREIEKLDETFHEPQEA